MLTLLILLGLAVGTWLVVRIKRLTDRVQALERRASSPLREGRVGALLSQSPLQGLRFALSIEQDHPNPVLATLLKEALLREDALVESPLTPLHLERTGVHPSTDPPLPQRGEGFTISGTIVCNGYADVYFRADLTVGTLFTLAEKPPHGDRQENLAREIVARLKTEMANTERRNALRELG